MENIKYHLKKYKLGYVLGLFLCSVIFIICFLLNNKKEKETPIQLEEICQSLQFYELDKEEWMEVFEDKVSEKLKVKDLKKILAVLGIKEHIAIPEQWKDNRLLTRENYYLIYEEILNILDQEGLVKKQIITVNKKYEVTKQQGVLCSDTYIFRVSFGFLNYCIGESYKIYSLGMEILGYQCVEREETEVDFANANIRVLLTYEGFKEWKPNDVQVQLVGEFALYFNEFLIKELSNTTIYTSQYLKTEELNIHEALNNSMALVPQNEDSRFILIYNGKPSNEYRGKICVYPRNNSCFFVNELPVEEYLYSVVPSEMPASYEFEALKVQAVCARSYAYKHLLNGGCMDYYAHVDDTTNYQVYNKTPEQESTNKAVDETKGMYLSYKNEIATTYYFSTSMGNTANGSFWGLEDEKFYYLCSYSKYGNLDLSKEKDFKKFIDKIPEDDFEFDCKYYRWNGVLTFDNEILLKRISERLKKDSDAVNKIPEASWGKITSLYVKERDSSGGIKSLAVMYGKNEIYIQGEYNIRYCLGGWISDFVLKNGEKVDPQLLPSAFFYIKEIKDGVCKISGGGYGHGIGMSQNGANGMAKEGYLFDEILEFYFKDCKLET